MTPPISRLFNLPHTENMCVLPPPEEQVCRAPEQVFSPVTAARPLPDIRARLHARYAQQVLQQHPTLAAISAFGPAAPSAPARRNSIFNSNPVALSGWAFLPLACNHGPLDDMPPPGDPDENPPTDNPPINEGGNDGGLGNGSPLTSTACRNPIDLDISSDASSLLMTCSDDGRDGNFEGVSLVERINATTGAKTALLLPDSIDNEPEKAVHLTSAASTGTGVFHAGFTATGSEAQFTGGQRSYANSGVFWASESDPNNANHVLFQPFEVRLAGSRMPISLGAANGTDATVWSIQPNNPVSMVRVGDQLLVLTANHTVNPQDGLIDFGPASVLRYNIAGSGALTASGMGAASPTTIAGGDQDHNGFVMDGVYNPSSIADLGDGRIAILSQGLPGENSSTIHVYNASDFSSGLNASGSSAGSPEIILSDLTGPDGPDFGSNSSSQLTIVGGRYALVGGADGSGRMAIVDLQRPAPASGGTRLRFVKIFDDGHDIANIVANPNGNYAYVVSDTGEIRTVTLTAGADYGKVGNIYTLASGLLAGTTIPAAWRASSIIAASPLQYHRAPIAP